VKVELREGQAVVLPKPGESFDPTKIPKAVKNAGFTPGPTEVTAVGLLRPENGFLLLQMPGAARRFVLAGGAKAEELKGRADLLEKKVRVTGQLHPSHGDKPPGLTVERWALVEPST
jgi:hypothetical protein